MCGIAGLIHRGKSSDVGRELQDMFGFVNLSAFFPTKDA